MMDGPSSLPPPPPPPLSGISVCVSSRSDPRTCSRGARYTDSLLTAPTPNSRCRIHVAARILQGAGHQRERTVETEPDDRTYTPGVRRDDAQQGAA